MTASAVTTFIHVIYSAQSAGLDCRERLRAQSTLNGAQLLDVFVYEGSESDFELRDGLLSAQRGKLIEKLVERITGPR